MLMQQWLVHMTGGLRGYWRRGSTVEFLIVDSGIQSVRESDGICGHRIDDMGAGF